MPGPPQGRLAIFPGSFDPLTNGHVDIILRSAHLFERIIVAVLVNAEKQPLFTAEERVTIIREVFREYPNIDEPVVSVTTTYTGASADVVESRVTKPLEDVLSGIEGLEVLTSVSKPEQSQINVRFRVTCNQDAAAADVRDRVSQARNKLPDEVDEPTIRKVEADSQPVIYLALASDRHSQIEVSDLADRIVKDRLQTLPGVAEVRIFGERQPSMRIWLDRLRLAAYGLTTQDVETALQQQNLEVPAGRIESKDREFDPQ